MASSFDTVSLFKEAQRPLQTNVASEQPSNTVEVFVSNYFDNHQIYLRVTDENGEEKTLHLNKKQAKSLSEGVDRAESYIGYDNT